MTPSIIITPGAELDLDDAADWYEMNKPGLSYDFRLALDATFSLILRYPDSSALVASSIRRALLYRFPHAVYYRTHGDSIEVIAILHTKRSPRAWQARN
jgi:plasmid stabilization system protein ParE